MIDTSPKDSVAPVHATQTRQRQPLARLAVPALLVLFVTIFSLLRPTTFATAANFQTILVENAVLAMLSLAVMLPLIVGEFDLALASTMGLSAMLAAGLPAQTGLSVPLIILVILGIGALIGITHAFFIVRLNLPSFVVTLGSNSVLAGLVLLYSGGAVLFQDIPPELTVIGIGKIAGVGLPVIYLLALTLILWYLLSFRPIGRRLYAVGANETAARLAGINTARIRTGVLIAAPMIAALAGLVLTARVGSANPTSFTSFFLPAFAAAFLSLAAFKLGHYNPWGVVFSVYLLAVGVAGLSQLGVPSWVEPIFNGTALIVAIVLSRFAGGGVKIQLR